jgi:hypothetical protein
MAAHLNSQPVPPIQIDPTLPTALSDIILMTIAKDPNQRFQTADAFRKALETVESQFRSGGSVTKVVEGRIPKMGTTAPLTPQAQVIPPGPPPPASRRGLYMAAGSLVTVAVLAFVAFQGPTWFKGSEASTTPPPTPVQQQVQQQPVEQPIQRQPVPQQTVQQPVQTQPSVPTAVAPTVDRTARPVAQNMRPPVQQPVVQQQQPVVQQPVAQQPVAQPQAPVEDTARVAAIREARDRMTLLGSRANSARATLTRMKEAQSRQGLGMRGDIVAAEQRMENFLDDAQAAIRAGDPEGAKKALVSAEREIDRVEGFLGR